MILEKLTNINWIEVMGFGLLHTSWLILLYSLVAAFIMKGFKSSKNKAATLLGAIGLSTLTFVFLIFYKLYDSTISSSMSDINQSLFYSTYTIDSTQDFSVFNFISTYKGIIITSWLVGAVILLCRHLFSYSYLAYIKSTVVRESSNRIIGLIHEVSLALNYTKQRISLGYSEMVSSPIIVGFIKPMIIFPIGLINQLEEDEIRAILAHEISHLLRYDQLINFLMSLLEIVFYFHPGIWWMNNSMRKLREEACDDQAISVLTDKMTYVKTLVKLQEIKLSPNPHLSLAIKNKESNFYQRIKRLLDMDIQSKNFRTQFVFLTSVLLLALMITQSTLNAKDDNSTNEQLIEVEQITYNNDDNVKREHTVKKIKLFNNNLVGNQDTIPSKNSFKQKSRSTIIKNDGNESVTIEMEDGEIKRLEVDGKEIPKEDYDKYTKEDLDVPGFENLDAMKMYFFQDGENDFDLHFDFPKDMGNIHRFEFNGNFPESLYIDSLLNLNHDSLFAFRFDSDLPNKFEHELEIYKDILEDFNPDQIFEELREKGLMFDKGKDDARWYGLGNDNENKWYSFPEYDEEKSLRFHFKDDHNLYGKDRKLEDHIGHQLNKDGFLIPNKENKIILTGKYLKINGEKQPSNIWNKYKSIFEKETGMPLNKKSRLEFSIIGKDYGKRYKAF